MKSKPLAALWVSVTSTVTLAAAFTLGNSAKATKVFEDVANAAGIRGVVISGTTEKKSILDTGGTGACWFDYNNDGFIDLYIVNGSTVEDLKSGRRSQRNYLYRNNGNGTFTDVTLQAGVGGRGWGQGCAAADFDNDGFVDLLVTNFGPNELFHNNGDGTFTEVAQAAGVSGGSSWHTGAAFADYDNDGGVDLFVGGYLDFDINEPANYAKLCNYRSLATFCGPRGFHGAPHALYHNERNGKFREVTNEAGVENKEGYYGLGVAFEDFDGDGRPDILVANDACFNYFYRNLGNGKFKEEALTAGIACCRDGTEQANMGIAVGDYNNDGKPDVFITTYSEDHKTLFQNEGEFFEDVTMKAGLYYPTIPFLGWGTIFFDYNNDGLRDLFAANGHLFPEVDQHFKDTHYRQQLLLFENVDGTKFRDVSSETGLADLVAHSARGAAACDFNNDGRVGIVVVNMDGLPSLLRNSYDGNNNWLLVRTIGTRSNRDGIGARVEVVAGNLRQMDTVRTGGSYLSQTDIRPHFGLGLRRKVDSITVRWPSGIIDSVPNVAVNQAITIEEGKGQVASVR